MKFNYKTATLSLFMVFLSACGSKAPTKAEIIDIFVNLHSREVRFNFGPGMNSREYTPEEKEKSLEEFKSELSVDALDCHQEEHMDNVYKCYVVMSDKKTGHSDGNTLRFLRKDDGSLSLIQ